MTAIKKAVIIGGGIAGPATALALQKAGIASTIHEAYGSGAEGLGGVMMVAPNGLGALATLGLDEAMREIGQPIQRMVMADGSGRCLVQFPGVPGLPPSRVVWRSDLYRVLHDHAVAQGVGVEYGKRLVSVDETAEGITAHFADGSTALGDVLIGADGIRSTVRTLIDAAAPGPAYTGLLGFGGLAEVAPGPSGAMHFVFGKRAFMGYWTGPDGRTMWFSNLPRQEPMTMAQARAVSADEWLREMRETYADDVPGHDLVEHTSPDRFFAFGAGEILPTVPHWHRGRMVLVGDSAHAPSSTSGQGASLAVESSIQLARCLRDVPDVSTAFATYERLRRPRVEKIAAEAAKTNARKAPGPVAKALMGLLMPIAMKTFMKPEKMFGWTHGYRIDWDEVVAA